MKFGYARVSSKEQSVEIQQEQLMALGVDKVFFENISGKDRNRPELKALLAHVRSGDEVIVMKLDRLARSTIDALEIAKEFKEKEVGLRFMDMDGMDINSDVGQIIYTVMASIAEFERKRIKARCDDGRAKAKADGKHLGRKQEFNIKKVMKLHEQGMNNTHIAKAMECSRTTIIRIIKQAGEK